MSAREHGGPRSGELESLGLRPEDVLDFSVNINPYGPAPEIVAAIQAAPLGRYPDPEARVARAALAGLWRVPPDEVAIGNGATDLLWLLARALLRRGASLVVAGPTFSELATAARQLGAEIVEVRARPEDDFAPDEQRLSDAIARADARVVYICAPNNPSGTPLATARLAALAGRHPKATFIVDQAFLSLSEGHGDWEAPRPENAVLVRSLTKEHAIPGLRLGAMLASPALIAAVERERPSWQVGSPAQAAAIACASPAATAFVAASRARMLADRRALESALRSRGARTFGTATTFLLIDVGDAAGSRERLLREHGVLVRDCTSFGLPTLIRVGARPAGETKAFLAAWDATAPTFVRPV